MTEIQDFWESETPTASELDWFYGERYASGNGRAPRALPEDRPWIAEPWAEFRETADEEIDWLVEGLVPSGSFAFVAAPPKKGKTWLALYAAIAIATGSTLFSTFKVPNPASVLYVALEGSRAALRARTGALARGLGVDPDSDELSRLHYLYRPRPFDLARAESSEWLEAQVDELGARFVVVDVLRAAARMRENSAEDFAVFRDYLEPMLRSGVTVAVLHHFGKLTETQHERAPGERMSGTGAMYGALDVGLLITRSEDGARRLRIDVDARDFAAPDAIGLQLTGTGSGEHGGFRYTDTAQYVLDAGAALERDIAHEIEQLFADKRWRTLTEIRDAKQGGLGTNADETRRTLTEHPERFVQVSGEAVGRAKTAKPWGTVAMSRELTQQAELVESVRGSAGASDSGSVTDSSPVGGVRVSPTGGMLPTDSDSESVRWDPEF